MTRKFKTADYEAALDSTVTLREALPVNHLARFIVDLVAKLDFSQFYACYAACGAPPYAPELLFALLLYYSFRVFCGRKSNLIAIGGQILELDRGFRIIKHDGDDVGHDLLDYLCLRVVNLARQSRRFKESDRHFNQPSNPPERFATFDSSQ
jgi:hypothetical protein